MHYHCEIVIPPTKDVEGAMATVLKQFDENQEDSSHAFWDWWVIGGRWSGCKLMARYDEAKLEQFREWLRDEKITVSGVQFGKQELSPSSQIPKVDAKWNEMFPSMRPFHCPMFKHSNQYSDVLPDDVLRLGDVPDVLKCSRMIVAGHGYDSDSKGWTGPLEAKFMLCESEWNGCNHMPIDWDGRFHSALAKYHEHIKGYKDEYIASHMPNNDWLVVTVDYHS
jgi:hypothetical protein